MNSEDTTTLPSPATMVRGGGDDPTAVRTAVEDLMHRVDELDQAPTLAADLSTTGAGAELDTLGQQAVLFEQAHQVLVDALDSVERA